MAVFWNSTLCSQVDINRRFKGNVCVIKVMSVQQRKVGGDVEEGWTRQRLSRQMMVEAVSPLESSANICQTTRWSILKDSHLHIRCLENLISDHVVC
jgi:hypothetical protein